MDFERQCHFLQTLWSQSLDKCWSQNKDLVKHPNASLYASHARRPFGLCPCCGITALGLRHLWCQHGPNMNIDEAMAVIYEAWKKWVDGLQGIQVFEGLQNQVSVLHGEQKSHQKSLHYPTLFPNTQHKWTWQILFLSTLLTYHPLNLKYDPYNLHHASSAFSGRPLQC